VDELDNNRILIGLYWMNKRTFWRQCSGWNSKKKT